MTRPVRDSGLERLPTLPANWSRSKLGFEATVKARLGWKGLKAEEYVDDGYVLLSTPNIKGREIDFENVNFITRERYVESPEIMLREGDVLLTKDGFTLGTTNVVRRLPRPTTLNGSIALIRPKPALHSVFLYYLLASDFFQYLVHLMKDGMDILHLFQADLRHFDVLLPPPSEQAQIASFLDQKTAAIDSLIAKKERLIELLQEKRQALITQAVTKGLDRNVLMKDSGVPWLGTSPAHWSLGELRRRWRIVDCKHTTPIYVDDGYPLVSTTEVKPGRLNLGGVTRRVNRQDFVAMTSGGRLPRRGDIIYSRNASLGSAAFVDHEEPFCMGQDVVLITSADQCQLYLAQVLNSSVGMTQVERACIGATFKRINVSEIAQILVPLPPPAEQRVIAAWVDRIDLELQGGMRKVTLHIEKLREYRQALITAAVTGKIDVSRVAA